MRQGEGRQWALYKPTDKSTFILSGDDAASGEKWRKEVTVKGNMDSDKKMITVTSMEASPAKAPAKKM